jgi:hypothetical protein
MTKRFMGLGLAAAALALSGSMAFGCDHEAKPADAKDAKGKSTTAVATASDTKDSGMPCCAGAKGCPKKKAAAPAVAAKAEPAKEAAQPQPAAGAGSQR